MKVFSDLSPEVVKILKRGGIGVIRTDTLYGIVARADDETAVERVYAVKGRDGSKSPIVLVSDESQLYDTPSREAKIVLEQEWPGAVSIILSSKHAPSWITRGNQSVAYRLPDSAALQDLLRQTGPLIAPSANPQGSAPAMIIQQAIDYFGEAIDVYVDGGEVTNPAPSKLLKITDNGERKRLR